MPPAIVGGEGLILVTELFLFQMLYIVKFSALRNHQCVTALILHYCTVTT